MRNEERKVNFVLPLKQEIVDLGKVLVSSFQVNIQIIRRWATSKLPLLILASCFSLPLYTVERWSYPSAGCGRSICQGSTISRHQEMEDYVAQFLDFDSHSSGANHIHLLVLP